MSNMTININNIINENLQCLWFFSGYLLQKNYKFEMKLVKLIKYDWIIIGEWIKTKRDVLVRKLWILGVAWHYWTAYKGEVFESD